MPELKLTIQCELDGAELSGFPLIARQVVTESVPLNGVQQAADGNSITFHQLTGTVMGTLQALVLTADQAFNLNFNGASFLPMAQGGIVVLVGANINAGANNNVTINNPGTAIANLTGISAGT